MAEGDGDVGSGRGIAETIGVMEGKAQDVPGDVTGPVGCGKLEGHVAEVNIFTTSCSNLVAVAVVEKRYVGFGWV